MDQWEEEPYKELQRTLEGAVDAFLATGNSPALVQLALTDILATDLIARQEGIMEMMGSRYAEEGEEHAP